MGATSHLDPATGKFPDFLTEPVEEVAERLLGCLLERTIDGEQLLLRIVETDESTYVDARGAAFMRFPRTSIEG